MEPKVAVRRSTQRKGGLTVSQAAERFIAEKTRDPSAGWTNQTRLQYETTLRLFEQFSENASLAGITREDAAAFLDSVGRLRADWGRSSAARGMSYHRLLESFAGEPSLTNKTLNRYVSALRGLFEWARKTGAFVGDNPFSGQMRSIGRRGAGAVPFISEEMALLFGSRLFRETTFEQRVRPRRHSAETALLWAPLIALYSGMRINEVCQLRRADVRQEAGVWLYDIREGDGEQSVKTSAGIRKVPVHSEVIRCGLLDYLAGLPKDGLLFPGLKPGGPDGRHSWYFVKRFSLFRRNAGVTRDRTGFHSFRKNVATALERARVPENEAVQVLGHEKLSMSYAVYSLGLDIGGLREVVEKVRYEDLDLSHLHVPAARTVATVPASAAPEAIAAPSP